MGKCFGAWYAGLVLLLLFCLAHQGFAERFVPVPMKISAPNWMSYEFNGRPLSIPVTLSGTAGLGAMFIFTSGKAASIHKVRNGNLGWHYVDNIDTCLYVSPQINFSLGANTVTWDGKDEVGHYVPVGDYTYYLWAYDSVGGQYVGHHFPSGGQDVITSDENGNPLSCPIFYMVVSPYNSPTFIANFSLGLLPESTLVPLEKTFLPFSEMYHGKFALDPHNYSHFYYQSISSENTLVTSKWQWVPSGNALFQTDWAHNGEVSIPTAINSESFSPYYNYDYPFSDGGDNLFFNNVWNSENGLQSGFVRMDISTGEILRTFNLSSQLFDLQEPFSCTLKYSSGMIFCNVRATLAQMIDPYTETDSDPLRWETVYKKDPTFEHSKFFPDRLKIALVPEHVGGNNCFELIAPDGSEIGYFPQFEDYDPMGGDYQNLVQVIDTGTPYDGLYFDNGWRWRAEYYGISYRASDSFRGRIGVIDAFEPFVSLLDPGGNEALKGGSERYITWTSQGVDSIRIEYSPDSGAHWQTIAESVKASDQRYLWTVPNIGSNTCRMRLIDTADSRNTSEIGSFAIVVLTGVEDAQATTPRPFITASNHPNPFNPSTAIQYTLGKPGRATLTVYNVLGQQVRRFDLGRKERGAHEFLFDGAGLTSGILIYRIGTENATATGKMLLLR